MLDAAAAADIIDTQRGLYSNSQLDCCNALQRTAMFVRYHRPRHRYVIVVVVVIIVMVLAPSVTGSGSDDACSTLIGPFLEAAYKCKPEAFHESVTCEWERLRMSCPKTLYLVIYSAQIQYSPTHPQCHSDTPTHSTTDDHAPSQAECPSVCIRPLFINPCQGRRRCSVDTGSKKFEAASNEACNPSTEARPKASVNVIYTCVEKSVLRFVFSNISHHSSPNPDPCLSVVMATPSNPSHAESASRNPSLRRSSSSSPVVVMVTPVAAVAAAAVERDDDDDDHGQSTDRVSEEVDQSTQLVSVEVTSESVRSSSRELETDDTGTLSDYMVLEFDVSLATVAKTTEDDAPTTPGTTAQSKWSTLWFNHLSLDWAWSYHFIGENKEKFFLYLALAISLGFIFILFTIVLRLSFRKPLASHPTDSPSHRCRCSGSLSPKADPGGGSSARQPLTMSCTSPITWRLPDIDPSIAGNERPGRGCDVQLTSFNRLNSLPRLRRDSIVEVPPPPSPVSSTGGQIHEEVSCPEAPVPDPPEVTTTATISRSHLNSLSQAPQHPLTNTVSRPVTAMVTLPLTTESSNGEASTAFTRNSEGNGSAVGSTMSSSNQFYQAGQMDPSLAARVSIRPMAKFGSFGRNQGGSPCGQEYRELRQFSKTLQLTPGNHYFCT